MKIEHLLMFLFVDLLTCLLTFLDQGDVLVVQPEADVDTVRRVNELLPTDIHKVFVLRDLDIMLFIV